MSDNDIDEVFNHISLELTDMVGHMFTIRDYSAKCERCVEFGVYDCTSTWALLAGHPKKLVSYDLYRRSEVTKVESVVGDSNTFFEFVIGDTGEIEIEETDLLFIDSFHSYQHLTKELSKHSAKVNKFILLHDTTTFGDVDQDGNGRGLWPAVVEFLEKNSDWILEQRFEHCHGLTVLRRIQVRGEKAQD